MAKYGIGLRIVLTNTGVRGDLSHLPFTGNPILNNMPLFSVLQMTLAISGGGIVTLRRNSTDTLSIDTPTAGERLEQLLVG